MRVEIVYRFGVKCNDMLQLSVSVYVFMHWSTKLMFLSTLNVAFVILAFALVQFYTLLYCTII